MQRAHNALAESEGKMAQTRPCVYFFLFFFFFDLLFNYTLGLADSYVGVPLSPCRGAEKAFNFVSFLSHM